MLFRVAVAVAGAALVSGCLATTKSPLKPGDVPMFNPVTQGYIVGSASFSGDFPAGEKKPLFSDADFRCSQYNFFFHRIEENAESFSGSISTIPESLAQDWTDAEGYDYKVDEGLGYVFVMPLAAGLYEFNNYGLICGNYHYYPRNYFKIEFEVVPGVVRYLGEVRFNHVFGRNFLNMAVPNGAVISFLDEQTRDMALIKAKFPFVGGLPVTNGLLSWDGAFDHLETTE